MSEPNFATDTDVIQRVVRKRLTPRALWLAIVTLASAIGYVGKQVYKIDHHQESITYLQQGQGEDLEQLQKMNTLLAVVSSQVGDLAAEMNRQREWREKIEDQAERPPHPRHRL